MPPLVLLMRMLRSMNSLAIYRSDQECIIQCLMSVYLLTDMRKIIQLSMLIPLKSPSAMSGKDDSSFFVLRK